MKIRICSKLKKVVTRNSSVSRPVAIMKRRLFSIREKVLKKKLDGFFLDIFSTLVCISINGLHLIKFRQFFRQFRYPSGLLPNVNFRRRPVVNIDLLGLSISFQMFDLSYRFKWNVDHILLLVFFHIQSPNPLPKSKYRFFSIITFPKNNHTAFIKQICHGVLTGQFTPVTI